jgi:hypothetical protein
LEWYLYETNSKQIIHKEARYLEYEQRRRTNCEYLQQNKKLDGAALFEDFSFKNTRIRKTHGST